jgi:hypothetical protein
MKIGRSVAAVASVGLLAGCAPTHLHTDDGRYVLLSTTTGTLFPEAQIAGELVWSADGCLSIESPWGLYLLQMPERTTVRDDAIVLDDESVVHVGDEVSWGGGYGEPGRSESGDLVGAVAELPAGCVTDEIAVVNSFRFYDH